MNFERYNPILKELASKLRNNSTKAEIVLWRHLRNKQLLGFDFHRQKPLGEFIADFYCPQARLVIEVDGMSHLNDEVEKRDREKEKFMQKRNIRIIRLTNDEVLNDIGNVLKKILCVVGKVDQHTPCPSLKRG